MFRIGTRKQEDRELIWWFEIPASDIARAQTFYEEIFRIKMTREVNEAYKTAFFPLYGDHIGGSIIEGPGYTPSGEGSKIYLNTYPSLSNVLERVETAGGKILVNDTDTPKGRFAWIMDTEGNKIALFCKK